MFVELSKFPFVLCLPIPKRCINGEWGGGSGRGGVFQYVSNLNDKAFPILDRTALPRSSNINSAYKVSHVSKGIQLRRTTINRRPSLALTIPVHTFRKKYHLSSGRTPHDHSLCFEPLHQSSHQIRILVHQIYQFQTFLSSHLDHND